MLKEKQETRGRKKLPVDKLKKYRISTSYDDPEIGRKSLIIAKKLGFDSVADLLRYFLDPHLKMLESENKIENE